MNNRREFLKGSLAIAGVALAGTTAKAQGAVLPPGIVYSKESPGRWAGREGTHVPKPSIEGGALKVVTPHGMSEKHYIVKHTVITPDGKLVGEKTFAPTDTVAESSYALPAGFKGALWIASFCNIHDLWVTELTV